MIAPHINNLVSSLEQSKYTADLRHFLHKSGQSYENILYLGRDQRTQVRGYLYVNELLKHPERLHPTFHKRKPEQLDSTALKVLQEWDAFFLLLSNLLLEPLRDSEWFMRMHPYQRNLLHGEPDNILCIRESSIAAACKPSFDNLVDAFRKSNHFSSCQKLVKIRNIPEPRWHELTAMYRPLLFGDKVEVLSNESDEYVLKGLHFFDLALAVRHMFQYIYLQLINLIPILNLDNIYRHTIKQSRFCKTHDLKCLMDSSVSGISTRADIAHLFSETPLTAFDIVFAFSNSLRISNDEGHTLHIVAVELDDNLSAIRP